MDSATAKNINAILFFANKAENKTIDRLKLMKLLWIADRIHLNRYGRLILKDKYCAMPRGNVPSKVLNFTKTSFNDHFEVKDGTFLITALRDFDSNYFSKTDIEIFNLVWNEFGGKDSLSLSDFSHISPEWLRYKNELNDPTLPNSYPIVLDDFFINMDDIKKYIDLNNVDLAKSAFHSHSAIQNFLND